MVSPGDFEGFPSADASAKMVALGLVANVEVGNAATTQDQVDTVYFVNPTGPVQKGTTITLKVYGPVATPDTPSLAPTTSASTVVTGDTVEINWSAQSCPSGQTLSGYEAAIATGDATITSSNPTSADVTKVTVTAGTTNFTVKVRYFCGQVESGWSPDSAQVTVTTEEAPPATKPKQ